MVNDARLAVGKSPIGFINPTVSVCRSLYSFFLTSYCDKDLLEQLCWTFQRYHHGR